MSSHNKFAKKQFKKKGGEGEACGMLDRSFPPS